MKKLISAWGWHVLGALLFLGFISNIFEDDSPSRNFDLNKLINNKSSLFERVRYLNGDGDRDYSYCQSEDNIYDVIQDTKNKRLIIVCKVEIESQSGRVNYFKYSALSESGKVEFCGWRDFSESYNAYTKRRESKFNDSRPFKGSEEWIKVDCDNFDILIFNHKPIWK
jgi:hypothetical protein